MANLKREIVFLNDNIKPKGTVIKLAPSYCDYLVKNGDAKYFEVVEEKPKRTVKKSVK